MRLPLSMVSGSLTIPSSPGLLHSFLRVTKTDEHEHIQPVGTRSDELLKVRVGFGERPCNHEGSNILMKDIDMGQTHAA